MSLTRFPHGVSSFGVPVFGSGGVPVTTGTYWFVDATSPGSNNNTGKDPAKPFATLAKAISMAAADDVIICMPGHAETITSTVVVNVANLTIFGLGNGKQRPNLTQGTTGSDNVMEIAAANVHIENIYFTGSTTGTSEVFIDVQTAGKQCTIRNCVFEQNTKNLEAITVQSAANYLVIEGCRFIGVAAGADSAIIFEDVTDGTNTLSPIILDCIFDYIGSSGCDQDVIAVSISSGGVTGILIQDCQFLGLADGEAAVDPQQTSSGRCTGMMVRLNAHGADGTDRFVQSDLLGAVQCYSVLAGSQGRIRPAVTDPA